MEPDYRIQQVLLFGNAINTYGAPAGAGPFNSDINLLFRQGELIFRTEGMWYPRGHLGDFTPYQRASAGLVSRGGAFWDVVPLP